MLGDSSRCWEDRADNLDVGGPRERRKFVVEVIVDYV